MRKQESCLGCGQMLVAVPAGGRWAHPSQPLPVSLFSVAGKATDGVRRFRSGPSAASSVYPAFSHPILRATCQGNMKAITGPRPPPPQGSTAYRKGSALRSQSPTNTLLPPSGCGYPLHVCFEVLYELGHCFLPTKHALSRSLSDGCFEMINTAGSFFTERQREGGRGAGFGYVVHIDVNLYSL